jgi:Transposase DDE domain
MTMLPQISAAMHAVLTTMTEAAATTLHYAKRPDRAKFTPSTLVQTLVFGWLATPEATVEQLAQMASRLGVDVSAQAIDQRFTPATATLLQQVLTASIQQVISAEPVAIPILQRFTSVRVHDSTTIGLPDALTTTWAGCGNASGRGTAGLKCGVQVDLLTGALCGLDLAAGRASDHALPVQQAPLPAGSLRLADLGFYDLDVLRSLDEQGVYWLSRLQSNSRLTLPGQPERSLLAVLERFGAASEWDGPVVVGKGGRVAARLRARRVPPAVAEERRRKIRAAAKDKGRAPAKAALALAAWNIMITNLPPVLLSLDEALVLLRLRWQIELLFKLWKSHGKVAVWRSAKPARILCEVYAKLLALVLQQWLIVASGWDDPERSLFKAAQVVRSYAAELASAFGDAEQFITVLQTMARVLQRHARMNKRRKTPTTAQRLCALTAGSIEA